MHTHIYRHLSVTLLVCPGPHLFGLATPISMHMSISMSMLNVIDIVVVVAIVLIIAITLVVTTILIWFVVLLHGINHVRRYGFTTLGCINPI